MESTRKPEATVDNLFIERWSPRSFRPDPLTDEQIKTLFEAARWAPSSSNSQPWLFLYETDGPDRPLFESLLNEGNRRWAATAPLIGFLLAKRTGDNGRELRTARFDAGAAWMSLALQARLLDLYTHPMGGIDRAGVYEKLGIPEDDYDVTIGFVAGQHGEINDLPEDLRPRETPNGRKPAGEVFKRGRLR